MKTILARLWKEEEGQDLTEYALLLVLVALAAIGSLHAARDSDQRRFHDTATSLSTDYVTALPLGLRQSAEHESRTEGFQFAAASLCCGNRSRGTEARVEDQA